MKTILNVKTDIDVKEQAQALAKHLGVPLSVVVNSYLKEFVRSGEFTLRREPQLRKEVVKRIEEAIIESETGKNVSRTFKTTKEFAEYLNS